MAERITETDFSEESINAEPMKIVQRPLATSIRGRKEEIAGKIFAGLVAAGSVLVAGVSLIHASWVEYPKIIESFQIGNYGEMAYHSLRFGGEFFLANASGLIFRLTFIKP